MLNHLTRRQFVRAAGLAVAGTTLGLPGLRGTAGTAHGGALTGRVKKAVMFPMIQEKLSVRDKFKLLQDLGFDGVEIRRPGGPDPDEVVAAREATGLTIHGVTNSSSPDIRGAIDLAKRYGASTVLLVPGRVDETNPYDQNYKTTQQLIRDAIPYAQENRITLLVENVWNNFFLSPLEAARYIDELASPWVGSYFDIGNVMRYGWPEQWIHILNKRVGKIHIKEYSRTKADKEGLRKALDVEIGEGDVNWPAVCKALAEINYSGWATAEVAGGDRQRLADVASRMDRVLEL
jgi:L-ribulose-5-phosphate 3-epimerase